MTDRTLIELHNVSVQYGMTRALAGVDFNLFPGEIHAITGEHRAGKSTLIKLISGAERKQSGTIIYKGKEISSFTPKTAIRNHIGIVYQNLSIIPDLTVLEYIFAHDLKTRAGLLLNTGRMVEIVTPYLKKLETSIDVHAKLQDLPAAQQYMVEFIRALVIEPEILILDELANKLTPEEMKKVYQIIFKLRDKGSSIIYISHNMEEITEFADRVTILRGGHRRETEYVSNIDTVRLYELTYSFSLDKQRMEYSQKKFTVFLHYMKNFIQHIPLGIIFFDNSNMLQIMNSHARTLFGIDHTDTFIGTPLRDLLRRQFSDDYKDILLAASEKSPGQWDNIEANNGNKYTVYLHPIKDESYEIVGSTIMIQEQTLNNYMENYLMKSEKFASVAEMAVGVAHEVNNPLFTIRNYLELIALKNDSDYIEGKLGIINRELDRIVQIISSLLSFSKINKAQFQEVDLTEVVEDVILLLNHQIHEKDIQVKLKSDKNVIITNGNENKLKQLFINLIANSIDAILQKGIIQIELTKTRGRYAEIRIKDTGNGIPSDALEKIFEPFYSTKINKKNTGLGLAISHHIVKAHNGTISLEQDKKFKTCFLIRFPI